jgi:hypothetical protein
MIKEKIMPSTKRALLIAVLILPYTCDAQQKNKNAPKKSAWRAYGQSIGLPIATGIAHGYLTKFIPILTNENENTITQHSYKYIYGDTFFGNSLGYKLHAQHKNGSHKQALLYLAAKCTAQVCCNPQQSRLALYNIIPARWKAQVIKIIVQAVRIISRKK